MPRTLNAGRSSVKIIMIMLNGNKAVVEPSSSALPPSGSCAPQSVRGAAASVQLRDDSSSSSVAAPHLGDLMARHTMGLGRVPLL